MSNEEITRSETQLLRKFRAKREESDITLEGMSERLQAEYGVTISPTVYAKVESGARKLKTAEIFAIADLLAVNLNDFTPGQRLSPREFIEGVYRAELERHENEAFHMALALNGARLHWSVANDLRISRENPSTSIQIRRKDVVGFVTDLLEQALVRQETYFSDLGVDETLAAELITEFSENLRLYSAGKIPSRDKQDEALERLVDALDAALPNLTLT